VHLIVGIAVPIASRRRLAPRGDTASSPLERYTCDEPIMLSTNQLSAGVAAVGLAVYAGSAIGHWWDLLTAWLVWGTVVLFALIYELRRPQREAALSPAPRHDPLAE
jgi:hypothetical protein